jgi:hypothetical protein
LLVATNAALFRFLNECARHITDENLFVPPSYSWHWLDWAPVDKRPYSLPINALLSLACQRAEEIAIVVGDPALRRLVSRMAKSLNKAISAFFDPQAQAFRSHIEPQKRLTMAPMRPGSRTSEESTRFHHNVHGNVFATLAGAGSPAMRKAAWAHVAECFKQPRGPINRIGFGNLDLIVGSLADSGYATVAYEALQAICEPFFAIGAPTFGESNDAKSVPPFNTAHGWSGSANTLIIEHLIGLRPVEPGWRVFRLTPPKGLSFDYTYRLMTETDPIEVDRIGRVVRGCWPKGTWLEYAGQRLSGTGKMTRLDPR